MPRVFLQWKFWAIAFSLGWLVVITAIIMKDPSFARGPR
jgi:hypothetical protein